MLWQRRKYESIDAAVHCWLQVSCDGVFLQTPKSVALLRERHHPAKPSLAANNHEQQPSGQVTPEKFENLLTNHGRICIMNQCAI